MHSHPAKKYFIIFVSNTHEGKLMSNVPDPEYPPPKIYVDPDPVPDPEYSHKTYYIQMWFWKRILSEPDNKELLKIFSFQ